MTTAGARMLAQLRKLSSELDDEFLGTLDPAEREELHRLLLRLAEQHLPHCRTTPAAP